MERQMALYILAMISKATMPADDQTQANIQAAKGWLNAIATGALVVKKLRVKK